MKRTGTHNTLALKAMRAKYHCVYCHKWLAGQCVVTVARVLLFKAAPPLIAPACMCYECGTEKECGKLFDSDVQSWEVVRKMLERVASEVIRRIPDAHRDGAFLWSKVYEAFNWQHRALLRALSDINMKCATCQSTDVHLRCQDCEYERYCSAECQTQDADAHRVRCAHLIMYSVLYGRSKVTVLFSKA